jgi:hypothetical protein
VPAVPAVPARLVLALAGEARARTHTAASALDVAAPVPKESLARRRILSRMRNLNPSGPAPRLVIGVKLTCQVLSIPPNKAINLIYPQD